MKYRLWAYLLWTECLIHVSDVVFFLLGPVALLDVWAQTTDKPFAALLVRAIGAHVLVDLLGNQTPVLLRPLFLN